MVARLLDGEKCVCDLTDALGTGQTRLSYHLKVSQEAGLVSDHRAATSPGRLSGWCTGIVLNTVYMFEDRPDATLEAMATAIGARTGDVIAYGHTHKPWYREVAGVHFMKSGSVGRPEAGDWRTGM